MKKNIPKVERYPFVLLVFIFNYSECSSSFLFSYPCNFYFLSIQYFNTKCDI